MKDQLLDQQIESQLLAEFAPKLVQVVFNDGSVKTRSSGGPIVSFAVDEGGAHIFPVSELYTYLLVHMNDMTYCNIIQEV